MVFLTDRMLNSGRSKVLLRPILKIHLFGKGLSQGLGIRDGGFGSWDLEFNHFGPKSENWYGKITYVWFEIGPGVEYWAAHSYQSFREVPDPGLPGETSRLIFHRRLTTVCRAPKLTKKYTLPLTI